MSSELLAKLQLEDLDLILRERRLRWFGHVARLSGVSEQHMICRLTARGGGGWGGGGGGGGQGGPSKHGRN